MTQPVLFLLLFLLAMPAFAAPRFPAPPDATVGKLGDEMVLNGIPMHIRQFESRKSVQDVLEFYRDYWPRGTAEKPGFTEIDALAPWKIITRVEGDFIMTVQVTEQGEGGSRGLLGMSKLPDLERPPVETGKDFPKMKDSIVINDIESRDTGKRARTLQLANRYSVESNANYYRDHYINRGWTVEMDKNLGGGNGQAQRFAQDNRTIIISINKYKHGSIIVAQFEAPSW